MAMDQVTLRSDTVLSDVHLLLPNTRHLMTRLNSVGQPVFVSKFKILWAEEVKSETCEGRSPKEEEVVVEHHLLDDDGVEHHLLDDDGEEHHLLDDDGDLDVTRRPVNVAPDREGVHPAILSLSAEVTGDEDDEVEEEACLKDVIRIEHTMATMLEDVGKQVWRGALLLSDFILSHRAMFQGATVLELGAGTGLASIVMASVAKMVYCTDVGEDLLSMCQRNVSLNKRFIDPAAEHEVKVRHLDWTADDFPPDVDSQFGWSGDEVAQLHDDATFLMAADVCYDDDLTDALFRTLYRITSNLHHPSTAYFCIEKRLNFTLRHMDVSCEAYDHFHHRLQQLASLSDGKTRFVVARLPCSFPQVFQYERVDQLEIWKVSASPL
ncbi:methyltransferase-like protein 22 isoform X2 [Brachyhypopomus gauderio]|uniref:methyltransferase-like protein 22 isoform X2 n=1 Tax=Brachyhypopomus gauderio TaxID=698409 RepID=UPI00404380FE